MDINDKIMQLIIRHLNNESSGADASRLQEWLDEAPENRKEFEDIQKIWDTSGLATGPRIDVDAEWELFTNRHFAKAKPQPKVIRLPMNRIINLAAAAAVLIGVFVGIRYLNSGESYSTVSGERLTVSLEDGTQVILGENSSLEVGRSFNGKMREVTLEGEGFFSVAKNPAKPFQINGPLTSTRVLGTAFQLVATASQNFVKVSEGKVAYWTGNQSDTLILTRGQKGSLQNSRLTEETAKDNFDSWKTGKFVFDNELVTDVLSSLQDYYVFSITNLDRFEEMECRFSGKFEDQDLSEVLDELALIMGMEYTLQGSDMHITKFYCE